MDINRIRNLIKYASQNSDDKNPALRHGVYAMLVMGGIFIVTRFGLKVDTVSELFIMSIAAFLAPIATGWMIRSKVFSPATVAEIVDRTKGTTDA